METQEAGTQKLRVAVRVRPAVRDAEMAEEGQGGGPAILCKGGTLWLVDGGGGGDGPSTPRGAPASPRPGSAGGGPAGGGIMPGGGVAGSRFGGAPRAARRGRSPSRSRR